MSRQWKQELADAVVDPVQAFEMLGWTVPSADVLNKVNGRFPFRVTRYYLSLIDAADPGDPIALQCLPSPLELHPCSLDLTDPVGDLACRPRPFLVRKHSNRVVILPSSICTIYCRFCFRRSSGVGARPPRAIDLEPALHWIESTPEIQEVIVSGGDPLLLDDGPLLRLLARLRRVPHVRLLRVHSRLPATLPSRITPDLADGLGLLGPLFVVTHFNHPRELTAMARKALLRLVKAGVPLRNQTVLLKGVNDSADVLAELSWKLLESLVSPYYLHHCDRAPGTAHLRTTLQEGEAILERLGELVSGPGLPRYVVDLPDGSGKTDVRSLPESRSSRLTPSGIARGCGRRIAGSPRRGGCRRP